MLTRDGGALVKQWIGKQKIVGLILICVMSSFSIRKIRQKIPTESKLPSVEAGKFRR